jgi:transcription factor IIIB subunit 2
VREVVYVSKIADITIAKRIDEFRRTKSAALTVTQFRQYSERLKHQHDPPSIHDSEIRAKKLEDKKRKRQAAVNERLGLEGPIVVDDQIDSNSMTGTPEPPDTEEAERRKRARTSEPSMSAQAEPRFDADGFAIPAIPVRPVIIDPALVEVPEMVDEEVIPKKRGRPKKVAPAPVQISEEELMIESELQQQIEEALDDTEVNQQRDKLLKEHEEARSKASAITQRELDGQRIQARRLASGITWHNSTVHNELELVTAEQLAEEFKDDPEVENCVLSGQAAIEKEKIWLYHNEDWLREQYEKELLKKIAAAKGANKPKNGRKKKSKMGEPLLTAAGTPAETPADATAAMLAKHAGPGFSKFVDYEALGKVYGNESRAGSRAGSLAPSQPPSQAGSPSRDSTPAVGPGASPPANGLASPEATQGQEEAAAPIREKSVPAPDMPSPPPTQAQQPDAVQGAQQEDETMQEDNDDEDEPVEDEPEEDDNTRPRYPGGYEDEDDDDYGDRDYGADDYGEEGYDDAIDPLGGPSIGAW